MSTVQRQDSFSTLESYDSMDSHDSLDFYDVSDDLRLEAPTLSSKEIERAREQALKVLETEPPSPEEEANRETLFEGSRVESDVNQLGNKVEADAAKPPKTADGKPGVGVTMQPPPKS